MNNIRFIKNSFFALLFLGVVACGSENIDKEVGICEDIQSPSITITSVEEVDSGAQIQQVYVSNIMMDDLHIDLNLYSSGNTNFITDADGNAGYCTIPCAFLEGEGGVSFVVSVDGYQNKTVEQIVEYSEFEGGCPSYSRGGAELAIQLMPVN